MDGDYQTKLEIPLDLEALNIKGLEVVSEGPIFVELLYFLAIQQWATADKEAV